MAVQAQYPSNVLFLNRNVQEGHDYSLQPQPGGFLDQTHLLLNNGAQANSRKRGREAFGAGDIMSNLIRSSPSPLNVFSLQTQPQPQSSQLIDLSQLHNPQPQSTNNVISTGLRLSSSDQQNQQKPLIFNQQSAMLSEEFAAHAKKQREEIDQFLQAQGEQLRRTLAEKRQRHYRALLGAAEEALVRRLREKEAEAEKARRRNAELQARAAQLGAEAQIWQAKARAQEAAAASLRAHLQQAMISGHDGGAARTNASEGQGAEDAESAYIDPETASATEPRCRGCRKRAATALLLPCRHLSLCSECDSVAQNCPVCFCVRSSSMEVLLS